MQLSRKNHEGTFSAKDHHRPGLGRRRFPPGPQDRWGGELEELREALKGKADAGELGGLRAACQREVRAAVARVTGPLGEQLQVWGL